METKSLVKKVFKRDLGKAVVSIKKCEEHVFNVNNVFIVEAEDNLYNVKLYSSVDYPEKDKVLFVSEKLTKNNIPHAKIISYNRNDDVFTNGYVIEEYLPGTTADNLDLTVEETCDIYKKLAMTVSKIHQIKLSGYGFIIGGVPDCATFTKHIDNEFIYGIHNIQNAYSEDELAKIKQSLIKKLEPCDSINPCLCHNDIQLKNTIVDGADITLIDWDDARSFPAIVDITRLTLLIELAYDNEEAEDVEKAKMYKRAFFSSYKSEDGFKAYNELELALHIWHGLVILNYCDPATPQFSKVKKAVDTKLSQLR